MPVKVLEEPHGVGVPHQNEVARSVGQVSGRGEAQWAAGAGAGHAGEGDAAELALYAHPITWKGEGHQERPGNIRNGRERVTVGGAWRIEGRGRGCKMLTPQ